MTHQLTFRNVSLTAIKRQNQIWFTASDLASALQYANVKSITNLYNQNFDEFSPGMSEVTESVTSGNYRKKVRIFSLRGAHLLAMFARTPIAKEFRRWALDILDRESDSAPSPIEQSLSLRCTECGDLAKIIHIKKLHRLETVMHVQCTNRCCEITHLVNVRHKHQIASATDESIKKVIGALAEDEKLLALDLLMRS